MQWTLETLNKAYQQGYMTGLTGQDADSSPYENDVLVAAWEAGWDDGFQRHQGVQPTLDSSLYNRNKRA
jgi:ribosome modulation factor